MPVIRKTLKDGEMSSAEKTMEKIRVICNVDKDNFNRHGFDIANDFLTGLWVGVHSSDKTEEVVCSQLAH